MDSVAEVPGTGVYAREPFILDRNGDTIWDKRISNNLAMGAAILGKRQRRIGKKEERQKTKGSKAKTSEDQGRRTAGEDTRSADGN
jgi:hypothetical protein